ncbi:protein-L-isoaspartate O-methyltransferase [Patescibacteria group bacterium]|nr:protein-L-isoaspartate O-methyltransferase [Patescibacteria group bacterium]
MCAILEKIKIYIKKKTYLWRLLLFKKPKYFKYLFVWMKSSKSNSLKDNVPWLTFECQEWLDSVLNKNMTVLEWGSGGSTVYISKKVKKMISIEHIPEWHASVVKELQKNNIENCEYILKKYDENKGYKNYYEAIDSFPDETFDLVIIDGRSRNSCISYAMRKIKKEGFLLLDNSERKRYSPGMDLLKNWERKDILGVGAYNAEEWQATIWKKREKEIE